MSNPLTLRPLAPTSPKAHHPPPLESAIKPWDFSYAESKDGKQANLLILLHGLGDTCAPFFALGKQLSLPATCVLSLQAPFPVPLMDGPSYTWHPLSPDDFLTDQPLSTSLESITTHTIPRLLEFLRYLVQSIGWPLERIHLFGWGQAGSVVLELGRFIGLYGLSSPTGITNSNSSSSGNNNDDGTPLAEQKRLGSITSICGPLLSHPPLNASAHIQTPIFYLTRHASDTTIPFLRRTFHPEGTTISRRSVPARGAAAVENAMPQGQEEWALVMRFWSRVLARGDDGEWMRKAGGKDGEVFEVVV